MKLLVKHKEYKNSHAICTAQRHFINNENDYFVGRIKYYEQRGYEMEYLWSESTGIIRLNEDDALFDCKKLLDYKGFDTTTIT